MKNHILLSAALLTSLSGCATTSYVPVTKAEITKPTVAKGKKADLSAKDVIWAGGFFPVSKAELTRHAVSADEKAEARRSAIKSGAKGCALGAGLSAIGALFGGGFNAKAAIAGCVTAGVATGIHDYNQQLNEFRALKAKVTVGALVSVKEKNVQVNGETTQAAESLTLKLDAKKVSAHHSDISRVIGELVAVLNKQTMPITVTVNGSDADRAWVASQLRAQVKNEKVTITEAAGSAPVIVVSPVPVIK